MKVCILTTTHNEASIAPWFLRYYETFADNIIVFDDNSTDGTKQIFGAHPKVELHNWPGDNGIDEDYKLDWSYRCKREQVGHCDWLMIVDADEFIYTPYKWSPEEMLKILKEELDRGTEVIQTAGYNMMHPLNSPHWDIPMIEHHPKPVQLPDLIPNGVYAPIYSKPIVIRPETNLDWNRGKHALNPDLPVKLTMKARLKLLHFRYLSPQYTKQRNARNWSRCGFRTGDKGAAWSCDPKRDSEKTEHSIKWTKFAQKLSFNVIEMPI